MAQIIMYSTDRCPYCISAERFFQKKGVSITKINVDKDPDQRRIMLEKSRGLRTVPQIFIDGFHIGGYDELVALDRAGKLDERLQ